MRSDAARWEVRRFMAVRVPVRLSVIVFFAALVIAVLVPPMLLVIGVPALVGALWTWHTLGAGKAGPTGVRDRTMPTANRGTRR